MSSIPTNLGTIVGGSSYRYQLTPNDLLWLARSVQYEGGNNLATAWTYAQRQVLYRRTNSLASLVQMHSQPVNPKWRRDGEFCRPGGRYAGTDRCSPSRLDTRDEAANLPWASVRESIRDLVTRWALGETTNPVPRATDFADPAVSRGFIERNPGTRIVLEDGNWYLAETGAQRWAPNHVQILPPGERTETGGMLIPAAIAAAGAVWYFSRGKRGGLRGTPVPAPRKRRR